MEEILNEIIEEKEVWKTISSYPAYEASTMGRIRNKATQKILKANNTNAGYYPRVHLRIGVEKPNGKFASVHRLVAETFLPPNPDKPLIDHIDRDTSNSKLSNLRWVSYKENYANSASRTAVKRVYKKKTPIVLLDNDTNKLIRQFASPNEAGEELGLSPIYIVANIHKRRANFKIGHFMTQEEYNNLKKI